MSAPANVIQFPQVMKTLCRNGLKGQKALSPGHRPGYQQMPTFALKGQKPYESDMLLPFQGEGCVPHQPRAMPWAGCLLAFQAVLAELAKVEMTNETNARKYMSRIRELENCFKCCHLSLFNRRSKKAQKAPRARLPRAHAAQMNWRANA